MNLSNELFRKNQPKHWASNLKKDDSCIAIIRHPTDGDKNIHNAYVVVTENNLVKNGAPAIKAWFQGEEYIINWNDLTQI